MPPLAGLTELLCHLQSHGCSPWATGCRPPRRASEEAEDLKLTAQRYP